MIIRVTDSAPVLGVTDITSVVRLTGDGADGRSILSGARAPLTSDGIAGDFWIDTSAWRIYGPKTLAGWGSPTPLGGSVAYQHTQATPASTWTVNHNLGYRPHVTALTTGGIEMDAEVQHLTVNQLEIRFAAPADGTARLT